ncbi:MAG: hypothetical protein U5L75_00065 [Candidatus Campbellbacteria bacterium]|nr:hypothetical protein [Candidatus Campbellbacteria bacterium]
MAKKSRGSKGRVEYKLRGGIVPEPTVPDPLNGSNKPSDGALRGLTTKPQSNRKARKQVSKGKAHKK